MMLRIDIEVSQMTEGIVPSPALIAQRAVETIERIAAFPVASVMIQIDKVDLVYNSGEDPNG